MVQKFFVQVPGFNTPAVGFEQPFEMLLACHDRVRRSLALLKKLCAHVREKGHDTASRSAAQDVVRYFNHAAPLHHEDEELHIFPAILALPDNGLHALVHKLQADHVHMAKLWNQLRTPLGRWSLPETTDPADDSLYKSVQEFTDLYSQHLVSEEQVVYPAARNNMGLEQVSKAGLEMQFRRQGR